MFHLITETQDSPEKQATLWAAMRCGLRHVRHFILSDCSKTLKFRHKFNIDLQNKDILQLREIQKKSDLEKLGSYLNAVRKARGDALSKLRSVPAPRENLLCVECQDEG